MTDDYVPQPRPPLTDATAAAILDFLYDLITDFEAASPPNSAGTTDPRRNSAP
jgi:hypothetical protein